MRLSYRIGTAALLIVAIFLIKRHLDLVQDDSRVQSGWSYNGVSGGSGSSEPAANDKSKDATIPASKEELPVVGGGKKDQSAAAADDNDDGIALGSRPVYETTPIIVPNDRVIVMAKLAAEDTAWVSNDLAEYVSPQSKLYLCELSFLFSMHGCAGTPSCALSSMEAELSR